MIFKSCNKTKLNYKEQNWLNIFNKENKPDCYIWI